MNWDAALRALIADVKADAALVAELGSAEAIKQVRDGALQVPAVTYLLYEGPELENTEIMGVRWDIWARTRARAVAIERRLRARMHHDRPVAVGAVTMRAQLVDARDVPEPDADIVHRSLDFEYEFAREEP